ncbi:MAG: AI-2E family transporter [Verrucomicrobiales bacterium]|nr:AI-2E family transporter [Verrucomicrobiales bacterium]
MATVTPARPNDATPKTKPGSLAIYVILGAALFAFLQAFWLLSPILLSFLLILLVTLALNPVISWMRGLGGGREIPTGLVTVGLLLLIALTGWALFGPMKASVITLAARVPEYWERMQKPLIKMEQHAVLSEAKLQAEVSSEIAVDAAATGQPEPPRPAPQPVPPPAASESGSIRASLSDLLYGVAGGFSAMAFNAAQMLVVLVTVFFGVIFTLMNPRPIIGALFVLTPERHHDQALAIARRIGEFVPRWAGATLAGMATIGLLVFVLMWPIFGFMDALVLGLMAGVLEVVPFVGPLLSVVPALLLALGQGGMTPVWVVVAYLAVQALENNVILPLIMARGMKVHPVAVMFSVLLCVAAFGVLGVLVAAPLVAIVAILHDELYRKRFLPTVTDADLDRLARTALREKRAVAR